MDKEKIRDILNSRKSYSSGTQITNCVSHMQLPWDQRPTDCEMCSTDKSNFINYVLRTNNFVNNLLEAIEENINE